jgi:hypothetical protein
VRADDATSDADPQVSVSKFPQRFPPAKTHPDID